MTILLAAAYATLGAVVAYNSYQEVKRSRWTVDVLVAAATEDSLLTEQQLSILVDATFFGLIGFSAVAWPVVVGYGEFEKAVRTHRTSE
jgi:hypothetical protein